MMIKKEPGICGKQTLVFSRVVGFYTPTIQWNEGKQSEFKERKDFIVDKATLN